MANIDDVKASVKCTYESCKLVFDTEKAMRSHKKHSDEHDYCNRCDLDFDSFDDYVQHKIIRPEEHNRACRVCGEEYKSLSGLRRHIDLDHKVDQELTCLGCHKSYWRACLFIQHLEFGECKAISADQFHGHVVHKHLVADLLKNGVAFDRFKQKTATYEAAIDVEEAGGVDLNNPLDCDEEIKEVAFEALKPDITSLDHVKPAAAEDYPRLPAQEYPSLPSQGGTSGAAPSLISALGGLSLGANKPSSIGNPLISVANSVYTRTFSHYSPSARSSTAGDVSTNPHQGQIKTWNNHGGKTASDVLFPNAKPTPAIQDFSIAAHDEAMEQQHGANIMRTHFWDPMSPDWKPEMFYDPITSKYYCPFICEQMFMLHTDLNTHIVDVHRITRMKCPTCLKYFQSSTALMAHCESRGAHCEIQKARDYYLFVDKMSGGFLSVAEIVRDDHKINPPALLTKKVTNRMEMYQPPAATFLQYTVTKPPEWKAPAEANVTVIGGRSPQQKSGSAGRN